MQKKYGVIRQKSLFDDEYSDEKFLREELSKRRIKEAKEKEKALFKKQALAQQIPPEETDKYIKKSIEAHRKMIIDSFGYYIFKE